MEAMASNKINNHLIKKAIKNQDFNKFCKLCDTVFKVYVDYFIDSVGSDITSKCCYDILVYPGAYDLLLTKDNWKNLVISLEFQDLERYVDFLFETHQYMIISAVQSLNRCDMYIDKGLYKLIPNNRVNDDSELFRAMDIIKIYNKTIIDKIIDYVFEKCNVDTMIHLLNNKNIYFDITHINKIFKCLFIKNKVNDYPNPYDLFDYDGNSYRVKYDSNAKDDVLSYAFFDIIKRRYGTKMYEDLKDVLYGSDNLSIKSSYVLYAEDKDVKKEDIINAASYYSKKHHGNLKSFISKLPLDSIHVILKFYDYNVIEENILFFNMLDDKVLLSIVDYLTQEDNLNKKVVLKILYILDILESRNIKFDNYLIRIISYLQDISMDVLLRYHIYDDSLINSLYNNLNSEKWDNEFYAKMALVNSINKDVILNFENVLFSNNNPYLIQFFDNLNKIFDIKQIKDVVINSNNNTLILKYIYYTNDIKLLYEKYNSVSAFKNDCIKLLLIKQETLDNWIINNISQEKIYKDMNLTDEMIDSILKLNK